MTRVFGIDIFENGSIDFGKCVTLAILNDKQTSVGKINAEFLARAINNPEFGKTLSRFDLNIADGRGVLWAARYLSLPVSKNGFISFFQNIWQVVYSGAAIVFNPKFITYPITENIPGVDALRLMLQAADEANVSAFFFGATQNDLIMAAKNIQKEMPNLKIAGYLNGYDFQSNEAIDPVAVINETQAKLLVVALGSPMQEYWIGDNLKKLKSVRIAVGEGGSLAFLAGTLKRAPRWMQRIGLEWFWRLFMNKSMTHQAGSRLKRVWSAVPVFIYEVVKWKIRYGATEIG